MTIDDTVTGSGVYVVVFTTVFTMTPDVKYTKLEYEEVDFGFFVLWCLLVVAVFDGFLEVALLYLSIHKCSVFSAFRKPSIFSNIRKRNSLVFPNRPPPPTNFLISPIT